MALADRARALLAVTHRLRPALLVLQASAHIPFLLDGNATCIFRGKKYIDGSLYDFIFGNNSHLLTCDGDACVIDYVSAATSAWALGSRG